MTDERLRAALRDLRDEPRLLRNWSAIEARRSPRARGLAFGFAFVTAAALAGVALGGALALGTWRSPPAGPLHTTTGTDLTITPGRDLELDDGSRVSVEPSAELELLENGGDRVRWWLRAGRARFDVTPGGPRRWVVETGSVAVEVLGTSFAVAHEHDRIRVDVVRGTVLVRGVDVPDGMQRLTAGQSIHVAPRVREPEPVTIAVPVAPQIEPTLPPSRIPDQPAPRPTIVALPDLTTERDVAAPDLVPAHGLVEEHDGEPTAEPVASTASRALHLRDADALRAQGRVAEAATLLSEIAHDIDEPRADRALAAFTLARLALDALDRPGQAAEGFTLAIQLGLDAPLTEAAQARRVEAFARAGELTSAREAAREYVARHPAGRWRHQVERWAAGL